MHVVDQIVKNVAATIIFINLFYKVDTSFGPLKASLTRISMFGSRLAVSMGSNEPLFLYEVYQSTYRCLLSMY